MSITGDIKERLQGFVDDVEGYLKTLQHQEDAITAAEGKVSEAEPKNAAELMSAFTSARSKLKDAGEALESAKATAEDLLARL